MVMYSSQVAQQIYAQQLAMAQMQQQAHQLSAAMGTAPMMPRLSFMDVDASRPMTTGLYGEQFAAGLANAGRTVAGMGTLGLGIFGAMKGIPLDPFSGALAAGRVGFGMAGLAGGIAGAAVGALPFYAASQVAGVYTGAFGQGMQQQAALNSTLRNNFNFHGGQGALSRGFSQQQMGQIGTTISQELRQNPFTSAQELNQLISQGAESGMFTAVRDVEQFTKRFRTMLDSLRKIQKELGGTLSEALEFTRGAKQLGIHSSAGQTNFAAEMRDTMATTGMDQQQLMALAGHGSMLSRATGGFGRQGAMGALRAARTLGSAVSSGAIDSELLSEATGGLQGAEAVQAFTSRILQQSERFSRRAMGRFSIFALSNENATGLDQGQLDRFLAGDISVSGVRNQAHQNVARMGRARALNREGMLRGALLEQGGLAGQIGMMRLMVGDRVMDQSDDLAQLVLQRRFGMSRPESQMMISLMRNQGSIAQQELVDRSASRHQTMVQKDIQENRSLDAFMAQLQHGLQDATGVTKAREIGRNFMTKISSLAERAMNDFLGIQASTLSNKDRQAIHRLAMGQATTQDVQRLSGWGTSSASTLGSDPYAKSFANLALESMGLHGTKSLGEVMEARGHRFRDMSIRDRDAAIRAAENAQLGVVRGGDAEALERLMGDERGAVSRLVRARLSGDMSEVYKAFGKDGVSANAVDAFMKRRGFAMGDLVPNAASLEQQGDGSLLGNLGRIGGHMLQGALTGAAAGGAMGSLAGGIGAIPGAIIGGLVGAAGYGVLEGGRALETTQDRALSFIARGGHVGASAGVDSSAVRSVLEGETFQEGMRRIQGLKGQERAQQAELQALQEQALKIQDPEQRRAALSAVMQIERNLKEMGGSIGSEFLNAVKASKQDEERLAMFRKMGGSYDAAAEAFGKGEFGDRLRAIGTTFFTGQDVGSLDDRIQGLVTDLANMDPNSTEYQKIAEALGTTDETRGLLMSAAQQRNAVTQLTGKGRRGRAAQAESALNLLTGGALSEMDFTLGGRTLNKRNQAQVIFNAFKQDGAQADELAQQLTARLKELGVKDVDTKVSEFRKAIAKDGIDSAEATEMYKKLGSDEELRRIQREGVMRMQQQQDPLGTERNTLLKGILDGINKVANKDGDAVNMSTMPG